MKKISLPFIFITGLVFSNLLSISASENVTFHMNADTPETKTDTGNIEGISYEFIRSDTSYSFLGSFVVDLPLDCITEISYDINHKRNFSPVIKSVEMMEEGNGWYESCYTIEKMLIFKNTSCWRVTSHPENQMLIFEMISSYSNLNIYDILLKSGGYFQFESEGKGIKITYYLASDFKPGILVKPFLSVARKEAIKFLMQYREYLHSTCRKDEEL